MIDLTTQLAKAICEGRGHTWGNGLPNEYWESHAKPALEFLTSTGRLIPAGGMTLTAEEFADLHNMIWEGRGDYSSRDRLRKRFPQNHDCRMPHPQLATLFCTMLKGHEGTHFDSRRDVQWSPAIADPAEEETKAEACSGGGDMHPCVLAAGHVGVHTDSRGLRWNYPASSPVVLAPTETEWQTCGHVPIGIVFRSKDRHPSFTWVNEGGSLLSVRNECEDGHFSDGEHCLPSMVDENFAPFVAAEEG